MTKKRVSGRKTLSRWWRLGCCQFFLQQTGHSGNTVVQLYSVLLMNSRSVSEVWEEKLQARERDRQTETGRGGEIILEGFSVCYDWVTGMWCVCDRCIFKCFCRDSYVACSSQEAQSENDKCISFILNKNKNCISLSHQKTVTTVPAAVSLSSDWICHS